MDRNLIESYYIDQNGQPAVDMSPETARDLKIAIDAFEAGISKSTYSTPSMERLTASYICEKFLYEPIIPGGYKPFLEAVKAKVDELLK